jgi:peptidoglycan DL-endopeptidase CwlO
VTDVEINSTARSGGTFGRSVLSPAVFAGVVVTLLSFAFIAVPRAVSADPLSNAQAEAAQITAQLNADAVVVDEISQQFEEAQGRVQSLDNQIDRIRTTITSDQQQVLKDQTNLRKDAIEAYTSSGNDTGLESLFESGGQSAVVASEYRTVASGNISTAIDSLDVAQKALAGQQQLLEVTQAQAQHALDQVAAARQAAEAAVASQEATLSEVKGQIATLVAQQQAAEQQAEHAAFLTSVAPYNLPNLPAAGGAATAIAAAESQIGVPYVWGGESPGQGFDCSGLTQWSWGRAGVSIPRTAQDQYDAIAHIPLGDIQPGDLLFWGDGTGDIYHVGMYVGNGDIVDAPQTGEDVQIQPIWDNGLVGAGRP